MRETFCALGAASLVALTTQVARAGTVEVRVTIENLAPAQGTWQTPFWVGFHNGGFDLFDLGAPASMALERLAEDGTTAMLSADFTASGAGSVDGVVAPGGPFAPGSIAVAVFSLDPNAAASRYFSYASMVIPSNDAFVANGSPLAHAIFNDQGMFIGADFFITGAGVQDAGTEVNDEIPMNTAFFGQSAPNTGTAENGVVHAHAGFLGSFGNPGSPAILADPMFGGADFTLPGYPIARITVSLVPGPSALAVLAIAGFSSRRRRR